MGCSRLRWAAVYCSVLQCAAVCCSVLQYVVVCCSVPQCTATCCSALHLLFHYSAAMGCSRLHCAAVRCSVLQCAAVCCGLLQCFSVLQYVAPFFLNHQSDVMLQRNNSTSKVCNKFRGYIALQQTATDCNKPRQFAADCSRLQPNATEYN